MALLRVPIRIELADTSGFLSDERGIIAAATCRHDNGFAARKVGGLIHINPEKPARA